MKKNIIISILIAPFMIIAPMVVFAESPTFDAGNSGTHGGNAGTNANTSAQNVLKTLKDYGLDQIAYALAQKMGQKLATKVMNKANGGASGDKDPNFIKDFGEVFSKIGKEQLDKYTTELSASKNPYGKSIANMMIVASSATPDISGGALPEFTMDKILGSGKSWETAASKISEAGTKGWDFYLQSSRPQNTPIGSSILAQEKLAKAVAVAEKVQDYKIKSSGFLPQTKCNLKIDSYKKNIDTIKKAENQNDSLVITDEQRDSNSKAIGSSVQGITEDSAGCIEEVIKNPGAVTSSLTTEAGKFAMDKTKNINGWGQIVSGIFISLFQGFLEKGLSSLKADYGQAPSKNTGGPEQLFERGANGQTQAITNFAKAPQNIVDLRNNFDTALFKTEKEVSLLTDAISNYVKVPGRLATLDICIPGPDLIKLDKRLSSYYDRQTQALMRKSITGSDEDKNAYRGAVLGILEKDFSIAQDEMTTDIIDVTKNIPGFGAMRNMVETFQNKKDAYQAIKNNLSARNAALSQLRTMNTDLRSSLTTLRSTEPKFANLPDLVFTTAEWDRLSQTEKDKLYTWATSQPGVGTIISNDTLVAQPLAADLGITQAKYDKLTLVTPPTAADLNLPETEYAALDKRSLVLDSDEFNQITSEALKKKVVDYTAKTNKEYNTLLATFSQKKDIPLSDTHLTLAEYNDLKKNKPQEFLAFKNDVNKRKFVIGTTWNLWEFPYKFLSDNKWSDTDSAGASQTEQNFLETKNKIRNSYNSIADAVANDRTVSQAEYGLSTIIAENKKTDDLIYDCNKIRELVYGTYKNGPLSNKDHPATLQDLKANKNTYFKSDEVKNSLDLPNILTRPMWNWQSLVNDGVCLAEPVGSTHQGYFPYEAQYPSGRAGAEHFAVGNMNLNGQSVPATLSCYGKFGYSYGSLESKGGDFNQWIDTSSNMYQSVHGLYLGSIIDLYQQGRISDISMDTRINEWKISPLKNDFADNDGTRTLFCKFSSVLKMYFNFDAASNSSKNGITCSKDWYDTSVGQATGFFLLDSLD